MPAPESKSSCPDACIAMAFSALAEGVLIIDQNRVIRYHNDAADRLISHRPVKGDPAVQTCRSLLRCGDMERTHCWWPECPVSRALIGEVTTSHFETAVGPAWGRTWVQASCAPVPGAVPQAILLVRPGGRQVSPGTPDSPSETLQMPEAGEAVLRSLVRTARELLGADYAALGRVDVNASEVHWLVQDGSRSQVTGRTRVPVGRGIRGRVVSTGSPVRITTFPAGAPDAPGEHPTMRAERLKAALAVPVIIGGEPGGVLMVGNRQPTDYPADCERTLRILSGMAAEALATADSVARAQAASIQAEREWLAAELHDGLAQLLAVLIQKLKMARWVLSRGGQQGSYDAELEHMVELSEEAHRELRTALGELRVAAPEGDFLGALQAMVADFNRRSPLTARIGRVPEARFSFAAPVALQVLRVIQEALANARKHSGGSEALVEWRFTGRSHVFTIADDGQGSSLARVRSGFGMTIMADRARRLGGTLSVVSEPQVGCTVSLKIAGRVSERGRRA